MVSPPCFAHHSTNIDIWLSTCIVFIIATIPPTLNDKGAYQIEKPFLRHSYSSAFQRTRLFALFITGYPFNIHDNQKPDIVTIFEVKKIFQLGLNSSWPTKMGVYHISHYASVESPSSKSSNNRTSSRSTSLPAAFFEEIKSSKQTT